MIKITIIAVGGLKDAFWKAAAGEYNKRLSAFCSLEEIEITPAYLPDSPSASQIEAALEEEGKKIIAKIPKQSKTCAMCIEGKESDSETFARQINDITSMCGHLVFIIGGSYGLSENVKANAQYRLSMSKMTFPHRMARVMLLEQIYRAFKINGGGTYHK